MICGYRLGRRKIGSSNNIEETSDITVRAQATSTWTASCIAMMDSWYRHAGGVIPAIAEEVGAVVVVSPNKENSLGHLSVVTMTDDELESNKN